MTDHTPDQDAWQYLWNRRVDLRLRVLTNQLYQQDRQRRLELLEGAVKVLSLLAGSAALAKMADPMAVQVAAAVLFGANSASLVFGWGTRARDASRRASDWAALDHDIQAVGERTFTEAHLAAWSARCSVIETGEPAANAVLLERSMRRACAALGAKPADGGPANWRPAILIP
jgi:hypothetical protein